MIKDTTIFTALYDNADTPSRHIRQGIFYEEDIFLRFKDYIPNTGTFLDIGANIGNHSVMFNQYFPERPIISFEANPFNYSLLATNTATINNIIAICCGLSSTTSLSEFIHFHPSPGCSRLPKYYGDDGSGTDNMFGTDLKDCIKSNIVLQPLDLFDISDVSFIKIDVELHEIEVFKGASNLINKYKPIIWLEDCVYDSDNDTVCSTNFLIDTFGYTIIAEDECGNILLK